MREERPSITVVIVTHNAAEHVARCLRSVRRACAAMPLDVVVVDNASTDGAAEAASRAMPEARVLRQARNLGFARASNLGAAEGRAPWIVLLNPDTEVGARSIPELLRFARDHPEAGITGGRTLTPGGALEPRSCAMAPTPWSVACRALGLSALAPGSRLLNPEEIGGWRRDSERRVDVVVGCFLMIGRPLWERLGGFDERFFLYGEEVDLCLRAAALGFGPMVTPRAEIVHAVGASAPGGLFQALWLLTARATLIRLHWRGAARRFGLLALWAGAAARGAVLAPAMGALGARHRARAAAWRGVWLRRGEWLGGY